MQKTDGKVVASRWLSRFFRDSKNETVLNAGCGRGPQMMVLHSCVKKMVAVDIDLPKLFDAEETRQENQIGNACILCTDVQSLPFKNGSFDSAIAIDLVEHVDDPEAFMKELHRVLKKNARLIITFPTMHEFYKDVTSSGGVLLRALVGGKKVEASHYDSHNQRRSPSQWLELMKKNGFKVVQVRATTMCPPLHWFGIPRFWYSSATLRSIDDFLCELVPIRFFGQSAIVLLVKQT